MDSTAQTGHNGADWQEEAYQKILALKEAHFAELQDFHLKISLKVHQPDITPQAKQSENYEILRNFKQMLDRLIGFLQISKSNITPILKERLPHYEKQIVSLLTSNRRPKVMPSQQQSQQQFQHSVGHSQSTSQHQPSQVMQAQQQDNNGNQAQQMNMSSAVPSSMQHGSMTLSSLAAPAAQQNITNSIQAASDLDPGQVPPQPPQEEKDDELTSLHNELKEMGRDMLSCLDRVRHLEKDNKYLRNKEKDPAWLIGWYSKSTVA